MLAHVEELEDDIDALSIRIEKEIGPFEPAVELLRSIPGVERRAAEVLVAELGSDMTVFPTAGHLASWAGVCPGQNESDDRRGACRTVNRYEPGTRRRFCNLEKRGVSFVIGFGAV